MRREGGFDPSDVLRRRSAASSVADSGDHPMIVRHQLYDNPMPYDAADKISAHSPTLAAPRAPFATTTTGMGRERSASIKFAQEDTLHLYSPKIAGPTTHQTQARSDAHTHQDPRSADIGSSFAASSSADAYTDPYDSDRATSAHQTRSQTLPRLSSGSSLVTALSQHFASSSPDLPTNHATTPTRSRFNLPLFPGTTTANASHRTARPPGPADMDAQESMRLVRRDSDSEDEEQGNDSREMEL